MSVEQGKIEADIARDMATADTRQAALDTERQASLKERDATLAPQEAAVSSAITDLDKTATQRPADVPLPKFEPKPLVDAKDYQGLSMALIGMALIGGVASKGNWMGVSSTLNGALKGYYDGNLERADREYKNYQTQFKEAQALQERQQKEFESILTNKRLTINDMLTQVKIAAAKYGRDDVRMEAEQKSIDGVWKRVETMDATLARIADQDQRQRAGFEAMFQRQRIQMQGATGALTDVGKWFVGQRSAAGDDSALQRVSSRFGAAMAAQIYNEVGEQLYREGVDPRTVTESKLNLLVQRSAQTQANNRMLAVGRLTESMKSLENEATRLVGIVNGGGMVAANATFNKISNQFGDTDLNELKTLMKALGTQYIETVTMPGSNAQLHATSSAWAAENFDPNTNLANLQGVFKAMNLEIAATHKALVNQVQESKQMVTQQGVTMPLPGGAPPTAAPAPAPHQPYADPEKERRYQEWKRAQSQ